jgi:PAS domain S-box-containing protein
MAQTDPGGGVPRGDTDGHPSAGFPGGRLWDWAPIPLLLAIMAALWIADLRTPHEAPVLLVLLNLVFMWLVSLCIGVAAARGFLARAQPGMLMLGCGALLWGFASMASSALVEAGVNLAVTVHNLGLLGAAACHLGGLLWVGRLRHRRRWLAAGYGGAIAAAVLLALVAAAGWLPVFFVQGRGGTPVRQAVLLAAVGTYAAAAWLMLAGRRRRPAAFFHWYGLGLALMATGLAGVMLQPVVGGALSWAGRFAQYLAGVYLFAAAVAAARQAGAWELPITTVDGAVRGSRLVKRFRRPSPSGAALRYGLALATVLAAMGVRLALEAWVSHGLPPYITFFPAVMVAALLGGFGPGLAATALAGVLVENWVLPAEPQSAAVLSADRLALVIFSTMGIFMSALAAIHRITREKAAAFDREEAQRENRARLAVFAEATFEGIVESEGGTILDCNEQAARMIGFTRDELLGRKMADLVVPEDRDRVTATVAAATEATAEFALARKDGRRIVVETHGRPVAPGSARRHTAIRDITARRQAEDAVRESAERYRMLVETMLQGVIHHDADGSIVALNPAAERILGKSREQLMGSTSLQEADNCVRENGEPFPGEEHPAMVALRTGSPVRGVVMGVRNPKTGERRWISIDAVPVFRPGGARPAEVYAVFEDITERKRAERTLRASEERLRLHAEISPLAVIEWDTDFLVTRWAGEAERIFGWTAAETVGRPIMELNLIFPEDVPIVDAVIGKLTSGESPQVVSANRNVTRDGRVIHCEWYNSVLFDERGKMVSVLSQVLDVTARQRTEAALRESGEWLRLALEAGRMAAWDWDVASGDVVWNEMHFRMMGYAPGEVRPTYQAWADRVHPDDLEATAQLIRTCMAEHRVYTSVFRTRWPDGTVRWLEARGDFEYEPAGRPLRCFGVMLDITDARLAEEELRRSIAELEQSNRELEQFAYISSHDLQEPLRQVRAFAQLLRTRYAAALDDKGGLYLRFVDEGAARMSALVQGLLEYSRVGAHEASAAPTSAGAALDAALANLQSAIAEADARITRDELPVLTTNPTELAQLFQNLVGNALKFRREGVAARVHVGCRREGRGWLFEVRDNGIGIAPEHHQRIFQVFQTLHARDRYPGTGIGLAICAKIVEQHGGRIWVDATPGGGSTFRFTLPAEPPS